VIDAHLHLFERGFDGTSEPGAELQAYLRLRQQFGIGPGLVVGYEGQQRFAGNNDHVCALARRYDWIVPLVHLDRERLGADPGLARDWLTAGAAGWSAYVLGTEEARAWDALSDEVWEGLDAPVPWSLNIDPAALAVLTPRLARLQHTTVLLSHLGLPGRASGTPAERLAPVVAAVRAIGHVRVKVSGLYAVAGRDETPPFPSARPYLQHMRDRVGVEHLVWGSDYTPVLARQSFASQVDLAAYQVFSATELGRLAADDLARMIRR